MDRLLEPVTRGDPESALRWTCKSLKNLARELKAQGFSIGPQSVSRLLKAGGYSLQANRKTLEGKQHPDRDSQFQYINQQALKACRLKQPFISVDTKKKENLGAFKTPGREWHPSNKPVKVLTHDFPDEDLGKVIPYGVYDVATNKGLVNIGVTHDTPQFAVASISTWWKKVGKRCYPNAKMLYITADSGGSNSSRARAWKFFLQKFCSRSGLIIHVRHFPPGTSKWNKVEHRMFCFISANWRARPLDCRQTVLSLISSTKTDTGLTIKAVLDERHYQTGLKISDEQLAQIKLQTGRTNGQWNYSIFP